MFQKSRMYGAEDFLQLYTIVNYIDEVYFRFMRNILGLGKWTPKSRFMLAIINEVSEIQWCLLKIINKYRIYFNKHPKLYNNIINDFSKLYGKVDER